jgi:Uma2 family endonuclease
MDDSLYEIVYGQRVEKQMSFLASWTTSRLQNRLGPFAEQTRIGTVVSETLMILNRQDDLQRRPDLAFVSARKWPLDRPIPWKGEWEIVPELAVEVVSPNDAMEEVMAKVREYFKFGVQLVWVVLPQARQVLTFPASGKGQIHEMGDFLEAPDLLPGFRLPLAELFPHPAVATNGEQLAAAKA